MEMHHQRLTSACRRLQHVLLGIVALLLGTLGALVWTAPAQADESTKVLLVLDVSGSMNEPISSGGTKFAAAKRALKKVADAMPAGTQVGLRVYGSKIAEPKSQNPKACTDTDLVMPIGPLDRRKMYQAVDSFKAKGETPIAYSLEKSVGDLGSSGKRVLVLISDGEETCAGDPCPTARKLAKSGVDLQFNAVGLAVNSKARQQLQCIAKAGDGNYYDAGNTTDLEEAIRRITQRSLRPFQTSGTPVKGTVDQPGAPKIGAGQYKDRYDASNTPRYYRVTRTPGSTITASIATIVRPYPTQNTESWTLTLATGDGKPCATSQATSGGYRATTVLSGAVSSSQVNPVTRSPGPEKCSTDSEVLLSLSRSSPLGNSDEVSVEVLIAEEPPISNLSSLPDAVANYDGKAPAVRPGGSAPSRLGGTSFSNSTEVDPGSWRDSVATGETVFYRVRLQPGQRLRVTAETPAPKSRWQLGAADVVTTRVGAYSPARVSLTQQTANLQGRGAARVTAASPQVRVRNREVPPPASYLDPNVTTAAIAGDYFVSLELDPLQAYLSGRVMQVRLSLAIDGQPTGQPQYATSESPSPSTTPSTTSNSPAATAQPTAPTDPGSPVNETSRGLILAGAGLLAVALVVGALWLSRRRGRPSRNPAD
jgi:Ca-activated chloride channel family protein